MAKRFVEVEIGRNSVRLAQWERGRLVRQYEEPLPEAYVDGGEIVSMVALGRWLKDMAGRYGVKGRDCRLILPDHLAYTRTVKLPAMNKKQISLNLPYEFRDFIHDNMEQYLFEYTVTDTVRDTSGKIVGIWVMALAVSEALVEEYRHMLRGAGWKLTYAATAPFVYSDRLREVERIADTGKPGDYCLVVPSYESVKIYFYKGSHLMAHRQLDTDTERLISEADYERLGNELCQTLEFYHYRYPEGRPEVIDVCGEGRETERLMEVLEEMAEVRCEKAAELSGMLSWEKGSMTVNLAKKGSCLGNPAKVLGMLLGFVLFLGCFGWFAVKQPLDQMKQSRAELSRMAADLSMYREMNGDYEQVQAEYQDYFAAYLTKEEAALTKRYEILKLVREYAEDYGTIHQIAIENQECQMTVGHMTLSEVSELVDYLEAEKLVSHVEVSEVIMEKDDTQSGGKTYVTASLMIVLEGGTEDAS